MVWLSLWSIPPLCSIMMLHELVSHPWFWLWCLFRFVLGSSCPDERYFTSTMPLRSTRTYESVLDDCGFLAAFLWCPCCWGYSRRLVKCMASQCSTSGRVSVMWFNSPVSRGSTLDFFPVSKKTGLTGWSWGINEVIAIKRFTQWLK